MRDLNGLVVSNDGRLVAVAGTSFLMISGYWGRIGDFNNRSIVTAMIVYIHQLF